MVWIMCIIAGIFVFCAYVLGYYRGFEVGKKYPSLSNVLGETLMAFNSDKSTDDDYIFWHKCSSPDCHTQVEFDDEPYCFTHSPDEGASLPGYSARREAVSNENAN